MRQVPVPPLAYAPAAVEAISTITLDIAERLTDPTRILRTAPHASLETSLFQGLPGAAILLARLTDQRAAFADAAHAHLQTAQTALPAPAAGISAGPGAVITAALIAHSMNADPRLTPFLKPGVQWLTAHAHHLTGQQTARRAAGHPGARWETYDAVLGLAGIGRVLLLAHQTGIPTAEAGLTAALRSLTDLLHIDDRGWPGWWLPAVDHRPLSKPHPSGLATTGVAHGVAGPLAFLSAALIAGIGVAGQEDAVRTAAQWLTDWRRPDDQSWPWRVTGDELTQGKHAPGLRSGPRDVWCYGAAGLGRTLQMAGSALHQPDITRVGTNAIATLATMAPEQWQAAGPTVCHGLAGILQAMVQAHRHSADPRLAAAATAAAAHITERHWRPHTPYGFPHHDGASHRHHVGLHEGAAGVALALTESTHPTPSNWDIPLLLQ
ncbi:lanthionine synthetase C family protein [Streptomyces sp. NPDC005574]|uniref:lanthionine synthetase C family protein n=1 Tax=Streptomyces sp. NPDC005574 TaxID=3156891 RepID=UPI0033ACB6CD